MPISPKEGKGDFGQADPLEQANAANQSESMNKEDSVNALHNSAINEEGASPVKPTDGRATPEVTPNTRGRKSQQNTEDKMQPQDLEKNTNQLDPHEKFSLSDDKLDTSWCNNFCAVMLKRINSYRRSKKRVFTEIFLPSAFLIFGVWLSSVDFSYRSDSKMLTPDLYPLKQKLLINRDLYDSEGSEGLTPLDFAEGLPEFDNAFDVTVNPKSKGDTFDQFGDDLYEFGISEAYAEPYMYGSYEIYEANKQNQTYKFVSYVNLTSTASVALFPGWMYESILKVATDDPEFEFKTRSTPYPLTYEIRKRVKTGDASQIIFFSAIAYSIVITVTMSYLVVERTTQLKHIQVITGMRLSSYWITNFIFDASKLYLTILTTLLLFHIFDQDYPSAQWILVAFPFGVMPWIYVWSYLFNAESAAQTFTFFCNMFVILFASLVVFILRVVPDLELLGDRLHYIFRAFPSYSVASGLYVDSSIEFISQIRNTTEGDGPDISPDPWHWNNNTFDLYAQGVHFFFWCLVLFLIEADLGKRCRKCYNSCCRATMPKKKDDLKLDSDVIAEATRIE